MLLLVQDYLEDQLLLVLLEVQLHLVIRQRLVHLEALVVQSRLVHLEALVVQSHLVHLEVLVVQ